MDLTPNMERLPMLTALPGPAGRTINPAALAGTDVSATRGDNGNPCALLYVGRGAVKVDFPTEADAVTFIDGLVPQASAVGVELIELPDRAGRRINPATITGTAVSDFRGDNGTACAFLYLEAGGALKVSFPTEADAVTWVDTLVAAAAATDGAADLTPSGSGS